MKRWAAAYAVLLLLCGCAAKELTREASILAVRATFQSHLSIVRNCESRGVAPFPEAAKAAGANLALVFAPPIIPAPGGAIPQNPGDEATWVPFKGNSAGVAGVRAFKCPDAFIEKVTAGMKQPQEVPK